MRLIALTLLSCLIAAPAAAQRDRLLLEPPPPVHWGLSASFAPEWFVPSEFKILFAEPQDVQVKGSEFQIGFVRGRERAGDWGVSFVRKHFRDGSTIDRSFVSCGPPPQVCQKFGNLYETRGLSIIGVEIYRYMPLATVHDRVQIGLNFAGGIGQIRGKVLRRNFDGRDPDTNEPTPPELVIDAQSTGDLIYALKWFPLGKAEIGATVFVGRGVKLRAAGGFNFPAMQVVSITFVYLFPRAAP